MLEVFKKPFLFSTNDNRTLSIILNERGGYELVKHLAAHGFQIVEMIDISKKYKTKCGYPVRNLSALLQANGNIYIKGEFFGGDKIWMPMTWYQEGKDILGEGEMALVEVENENVEPV